MRRLLLAAAVVATGIALAAPARAHGDREVGRTVWTVGWASEPALVGQPNAVQVMIERGGEPVEGAEESLRVSVEVGDETTDRLPLRTVFDSPGEYRADVLPTVVGDYTFVFSGSVDGEEIDESFTASEDGFAEVEGTSEIAFPKEAPTTTELFDRIAALEADVDDANSATSTARLIAIVAAIVAVAALAFGRRGRRSA